MLVNRNISQSCLQCLDYDTSFILSPTWAVRTIAGNEIILRNNAGGIDGFENVDGVLVLEEPMQLLGDGAQNFIVVACIGPPTYGSILVYSSG